VRSFRRRLQVVGSGAVVCACLAVLFACWTMPHESGLDHFQLCLLSLAGPFAMAYEVNYSVSGMFAWGAVLLAAIASHPSWPNAETATISMIGMCLWFFIGVIHTYAWVT
jgi:hypothetical protein